MTELRISDDLVLPYDVITQTVGIFARKGAGKALALDTPLPTPTGWTTMGAVREGDVLFDESGRQCRVTYTAPVAVGNECFRVVFSDGTSIVADAEHLWLSQTLASRAYRSTARPGARERKRQPPQSVRTRRPELVTTRGMAESLMAGSVSAPARNHAIALAGSLECESVDLPIDPYVLGVWLGDGTAANATITTADAEVLEEIAARGYPIGRRVAAGGSSSTYRIGRLNGSGPPARLLHTELRISNLLNNKHVPEPYLRASAPDRLALLSGLLDSDGTVDLAGGVEFSNSNPSLSDAVAELARSLGWKPTRSTKRTFLDRRERKLSYRVRFRPTQQVFRLARKGDRLRFDRSQQGRRTLRYVTAVEAVTSVPVRCIAVDSPSRLFLAGEGMIPTHNTYTAKRLVEEIILARLPVCVLDPLGAWWGLRSSADGEHEGLPVIVLGGEHGHIPLDPESGSAIADLIVDHAGQYVIDMSDFASDAAQDRFATAFVQRLYRRKARDKSPMLLVIDEADSFAPQQGSPGQSTMVGAFRTIATRARIRGIGSLWITQRPAVLNASIRAMMELLILLQITGKLDREAVVGWLKGKGTSDEILEVERTLATLQTGEFWASSPAWLGLLVRSKASPSITFDSSKTPEVGQMQIEPRVFSDIDIANLGAEIAAAVEAQQANDPDRLKARIKDLEKQVKAGGGAVVEKIVEKIVDRPVEVVREVSVLSPADRVVLQQAQSQIAEALARWPAAPRQMTPPAKQSLEGHRIEMPALRAVNRARAAAVVTAVKDGKVPGVVTGDVLEYRLSKMELAVLNVLYQFPQGRSTMQIALLSGYSPTSGALGQALANLRKIGAIEGPGSRMFITDTGREVAGDVAELPKGQALLDYWLGRLPKMQSIVLAFVVQSYPNPVTVFQIAEAGAYSPTSGALGQALADLRKLELIEGPGTAVVANAELAEAVA